MAPKKYIDRMSDIYLRLFGTKPKTLYSSPLENGDHPELDISPELDAASIKKYQSLIGAAQWAVSLGRLDITTAVMTLCSFQAAPREGHLSRICRVFGYLTKMKYATICFRTGIPDYSAVPIVEHGWQKTVYRDAQKLVPDDALRPLGKPVLTTTFVEANLCLSLIHI